MITEIDNQPAPGAPGARGVYGLAKASCFAGILGLMGLAAVPPRLVLMIAGIAIICGHIARRRIRMHPATTGGSGVALAGLTLGYMSVCLALLDSYNLDRALNRARTITTLATATALESAVNGFHTEWGTMPDVANRVTTNSPQGIALINILLGDPQSPHQMRFLSVREGKNRKNGLIYSPSGDSVEGLFDSWGNPYSVMIDTDYDKILHFKIAGKEVELKDRRVAVFSPGADHKEGTSDDIRTFDDGLDSE